MMGGDRGELLHRHYETAVERFGRNMKVRGQVGFGILAVVVLLLFRVTTPDLAELWIESWVQRQVTAEEEAAPAPAAAGEEVGDGAAEPPAKRRATARDALEEGIDFDFLTSVVWFGLSSLLVLYCRWSLILERQGDYLRRLEQRLDEAAGGPVATEFLDLRADRPLFFRVAQHVYSLMMMAVLLAGGVVVLWWELRQEDASWYRWVDLGIFCIMAALSVVFLIDVVRGTTADGRRR